MFPHYGKSGTPRKKRKYLPTKGDVTGRRGPNSRKMANKPGPKGITPTMARYITSLRSKYPSLSQPNLAARVSRKFGVSVSAQAISRWDVQGRPRRVVHFEKGSSQGHGKLRVTFGKKPVKSPQEWNEAERENFIKARSD